MCAQPFGWLTFVEVTQNLHSSGTKHTTRRGRSRVTGSPLARITSAGGLDVRLLLRLLREEPENDLMEGRLPVRYQQEAG